MFIRLAAVAALLACAAPAAARSGPVIVPMEPFIERTWTVEVLVDGQPARMMFDTGAGVTAFSPAFAARIGCTPHGTFTGHRLTGQAVTAQKCGEHQVTLGGHTGTVDAAVVDTTALLTPDAPPVDGFVGLDALDGAVVTLDLADARLILETPESLAARVGGDPGAPLRRQTESGGRGLTVFAPVEAQIGSLWFLVDSGNMANIMVPAGTLEQWGFTPEQVQAAMESRTGVEVPLNVIAAPESPKRVAARPIIHDGVLNEGFIRAYEVTIDLSRDRIWYRPAQ